jgi:hypothetical protein
MSIRKTRGERETDPCSARVGRSGVWLLTWLLGCTSAADVQSHDALSSVVRDAKPIVDLRWRVEDVEQDGLAQSATAVTLRSRLGFETGKALNTSLLAEAELIWPLDAHYNSTTDGKTNLPIIPDPQSHEINRLQLTNSSLPDTTVVLGRQRIVLDDQRFVADVGWRQNEQTFDAVRVTNRSVTNLTVDVAYLSQINRVFGKASPVGRYDGANYVANISYETKWGKVTGFAYLLDFTQAPADSSRTLGMRFAGERRWHEVAFTYSGSWATQDERAASPVSYSDDYYAAELIAALSHYSVGAGIEVLGGDGRKGFSAPLATLHRFQGWADKFLTTPPDGIEDCYAQLGYATQGVGGLDSLAASLIFHNFRAMRGSLEYGSEADLQLQARWRRFSGALKYADYHADHFATSTRKYWAQVEFLL